MTKDLIVASEESVPSWTDLTTAQQQAVIALSLSCGKVNRASALYKASTGFSRSQFYETVYPVVKPYWKELAPKVPEHALMILQGGSVGAAYELVEELKHKDVKIRNKAANDTLDKVFKNQVNGVQTNVQVINANIPNVFANKYGVTQDATTSSN